MKEKNDFSLPEIRLFGNKEVLIEECRRIILCTGDKVELVSALYVAIEGKNLQLIYLNNNNIVVRGTIRSVNLVNDGEKR